MRSRSNTAKCSVLCVALASPFGLRSFLAGTTGTEAVVVNPAMYKYKLHACFIFGFWKSNVAHHGCNLAKSRRKSAKVLQS